MVITIHEIYEGEIKTGYFSSLKYYKLWGKNLVILRAGSGMCYICQVVSSKESEEYFQIGENDTKCFIKILVCGTTDEDFIDVVTEINKNPDKYVTFT
ncbi:MAG: hypothetical protein UH239_10145 [Acutalibacteraceae bacterium]|nr:hypothetical protein [Acutalibacteraceae bacterium]